MKSEIAVIVDRSGSMGHLVTDTIGGFNAFLESQKKIPGEAKFTLVTFDNNVETIVDRQELSGVQPLNQDTYRIGGSTALNDAIGMTITRIGSELNNTPEADRPDKVIIAILTDGYENASREYNTARIKQMIEHQESKYGWEVLYLAANQDAFAVGNTIGIRAVNTVNFDANSLGVAHSYSSMDTLTRSYRADDVGEAKLSSSGSPS